MKNLKTICLEKSEVFQRNGIEINGKTIGTPTFGSSPTSHTELDILCDVVGLQSEELETTNYMKIICNRIYDNSTIVSDYLSQDSLGRYTNTKYSNCEIYRNIEKTRIKLVDPSPPILRNRGEYIKKLLRMSPPDYLRAYIQEFQRVDSSRLGSAYKNFWSKLEESTGGRGKTNLGHFIDWFDSLEQRMGSDIFLPPVPHITVENADYLTDIALKINQTAYDLSSRDTATYISLDAGVFRNRECIEKILGYISGNKNKCKINIFYISKHEELFKPGFGESGRKIFELFLQTVKSLRQNPTNPQVFGTLYSGGFGYCLLGAGFDFFVDTVSNYDPYFFGRRGKRSEHRKFLSDETLTMETFEGAVDLAKNEQRFPLVYDPQHKFSKLEKFDKQHVDGKEWSRHSKMSGICMWNTFVGEAIKSIPRGTDTLFFDKIQRSDYAILANMVRRLNSI